MRKPVILLAAASAFALAGCMSTQQQNELGGALGGAAVGFVGAKAFGANDTITAVATVVGAAAGAGLAQPKQCRFRHSDGRITTGPCPE